MQKSKKPLLVCLLLSVSLTACGKVQPQDNFVQTEQDISAGPDDSMQADTSVQETPAPSDRSDNTIQAGDVELTLCSVEINERIGLMRRTFAASGDQEQIEALFGNALNRTDPAQQDGKTISIQTAFYKEESEIWKFSCNLQGEDTEYTFREMTTESIADQSFTAATSGGRQATVILTPYAAWIRTDGAWMDMADAYQFTAVLSDGSEQEIAILPLARSRQARERTLKELPYLGDGYKTGEELTDESGDAVGGRFIFYEQISPEEITDVHIYK